MTGTRLNFGYPWWLSYGHLTVLVLSAALFALAWWRNWSRWTLVLLGVLIVWSAAAAFTMRFVMNINTPPPLPTESFLASSRGSVLDLGAGTGRSSIMVLAARPQATLVALDLFGESFDTHFGHEGSPQQRLLRNLEIAGVDSRASIKTGDMRELPFESGTFDAIVSAYAVDHLARDGVRKTLAEAARVVRPDGEFLLILTNGDAWSIFLFGPLLQHTARPSSWYRDALEQADFHVVEQGTSPITVFFYARRR